MFDGNKSLTLKMVRMHGLKSQVWMVIVAQVAAAHIAKYTWSTCTSGRAGALYCIALFDLAKWSRKRAPSLYDASSLNIQLCGLDICQLRSVSQIANVLMFFFSLLAGPVTGVKRKLSQISLATYHKKCWKTNAREKLSKKGMNHHGFWWALWSNIDFHFGNNGSSCRDPWCIRNVLKPWNACKTRHIIFGSLGRFAGVGERLWIPENCLKFTKCCWLNSRQSTFLISFVQVWLRASADWRRGKKSMSPTFNGPRCFLQSF